MSHYSVCVTVPHHYDGTQVDAEVIESCLDKILAPFDEQTDEESYCEFEDRTAEAKSDYETETTQAIRYPDGSVCMIHDAKFRKDFYLIDNTIYARDPDGGNSGRIQSEESKALEFLPACPLKLLFSTFEQYCKEYSGLVQDDAGAWGYYTNPNAKWDWWQIGGRFPGHLLVKADLQDCIQTGESCECVAPDGYKFVDAARKKDICWDVMKEIGTKAVEQSYEQCVAAFASGDVKDFGFFATLTEDGIRGWGEMIYIKGETLDDYKARKGVTDSDQYLIGDYAYIDRNGDWSGSGDMGWFGISSNDKPERTWKDELQAFMDEVQDDDFIAIVDCHI